MFLAYDTPEGVTIIRPAMHERGEDESTDDFLRRVLARNVETSAQRTRRGIVVNPNLTQTTPVYVVGSVPDIGSPERAAWKIPATAKRIQ